MTCLDCFAAETGGRTADRGVAGGSASREWQRRRERREAGVRERYGRLGGLVLALRRDPHSTRAWEHGAEGERLLGSALDRLREEGIAVLHDRRLPGSRANIDHLVVSAAGVFVIDAKNYKGRVECRDRGGLFSIDYRLYVAGRDRTKLLAGLARQANAIRSALAPDLNGLPVAQAICFVGADWSLFARPLRFGEAYVLWPRALLKLLRADGPLTAKQIETIEQRLGVALPPA